MTLRLKPYHTPTNRVMSFYERPTHHKFLLDKEVYSGTIWVRPKILTKPIFEKEKPNYFVTVYGRKLEVKIRKVRTFYSARLKINTKIWAYHETKEKLLLRVNERLSKVFEKCAAKNNFTAWNHLTSV